MSAKPLNREQCDYLLKTTNEALAAQQAAEQRAERMREAILMRYPAADRVMEAWVREALAADDAARGEANTEPRRTEEACCFDCARRYGDEHGFPDLLVSNDVWRVIGPHGDQGGLLCPSCIVGRCARAGITMSATWASGPFS